MENESSRTKLRGYQNRAVKFIRDTPGCALFVDMGLGKTVATLTATRDLSLCLEVGKILVVAPKRVALNTWSDEIAGWEHIGDMTYAVLAGLSPVARGRRAMGNEQVHIINRENLVWLVQFFGKNWPYDTVILDESSSFKNHASKRFKALRRVRPMISRVIALTGTPAAKGLMGLWAQIALLDGGQRLGRTITEYRERYFDKDFLGYDWVLKEGAEAEIRAKIADICLSMRAQDYLELPELISTYIKVDMPELARDQYLELEKDMLLQLEDKSMPIVALTAAALSNKLRQCCNGAIYDEFKGVNHIHDAKLDALEEIVEGTADQPLLVAYEFQADVPRILERFPGAEFFSADPGILTRWNAGEIPILVAHPASCGHGLNMQHGGNNLVFFGLPWSLELYQQIIERIGPTRQKQSGYDRPVFVRHIMIRDTVEDRVIETLRGHARTQAELMKALRDDATERLTKR